MTQQTSPFIEGKYGWALGESNWNLGMDENLLKFSYLFDKNLDGIVASLPPIVNGEAYFLTTDKRVYFSAGGVRYSSPVPKWFLLTLKSSGQLYQFDGTNLNSIPSTTDLAQSNADLLNSTDIAKGAARVGFKNRTVYDRLREDISIIDFKIPGQLNWDAAFAAARAYLDSSPTPARLVFPAGIYEYTVSPSWAKQDCHIVGDGEVRLRYSGTGNAFILDAGPNPADLVYNMTVGPFIIEAPNTALNGAFIRSVHHSDIDLTVRGAGTTSAGILINFAVCNLFKLTCSVNQEGWYLGANPQYGVVMDVRGALEHTSYCIFLNPIMEGLVDGIRMPGALGNTFLGGTSEACTNGVIIGPLSYANKFYGIDLEANTVIDIFCDGYDNDFVNVDSDIQCTFTASSHNNQVIGGNYNGIQVALASYGNLISGARINRSGAGGVLDVQGNNRNINCYNVGLNKWIMDLGESLVVSAVYDPASLTTGTSATTTVSVTGAALGDFVDASFSLNLQGIDLTAWVSSAGTVSVKFLNQTGGTIDLGSGTILVKIKRG